MAYSERVNKAHFTKVVQNDEILEHDYTLSVNTYVAQEDTIEKINIGELNTNIDKMVAKEQRLREEIAKIICEIEGKK